ncbi:hypothetical protein F2Q69_00058608 [Brassica cretica]|uniref:Uncharacterized protein n=1 Tax=Brassica cretica TaxID=69181 RepID=A0A8S9RH47_BRACR|nr:hypothetical protein F2Q69_00058608 [Brassica cretica]
MKRILIWIRLNCPKAEFPFSQQGFASTTPPGFLFRVDENAWTNVVSTSRKSSVATTERNERSVAMTELGSSSVAT